VNLGISESHNIGVIILNNNPTLAAEVYWFILKVNLVKHFRGHIGFESCGVLIVKVIDQDERPVLF